MQEELSRRRLLKLARQLTRRIQLAAKRCMSGSLLTHPLASRVAHPWMPRMLLGLQRERVVRTQQLKTGMIPYVQHERQLLVQPEHAALLWRP